MAPSITHLRQDIGTNIGTGDAAKRRLVKKTLHERQFSERGLGCSMNGRTLDLKSSALISFLKDQEASLKKGMPKDACKQSPTTNYR